MWALTELKQFKLRCEIQPSDSPGLWLDWDVEWLAERKLTITIIKPVQMNKFDAGRSGKGESIIYTAYMQQ